MKKGLHFIGYSYLEVAWHTGHQLLSQSLIVVLFIKQVVEVEGQVHVVAQEV